jgi:deoxyhypusine synthase
MHAAWQVTSLALQSRTQLTAGVRLADATGAEVMEADSWGKARTPAAKARMAMEYFIFALLVMVKILVCRGRQEMLRNL